MRKLNKEEQTLIDLLTDKLIEVAHNPKRPRPRKGSFDWLYAQAEKSYLAKLRNKAI